jgi:hypothetical protein
MKSEVVTKKKFFPPEKPFQNHGDVVANIWGSSEFDDGVFFRWNTNFHVLTFLFIIRLKSCR